VARARELLRSRRREWACRVPITSGSLSFNGGEPMVDEPTAIPMAMRGRPARGPSLRAPTWTVDVVALERHRIVRGWSRLELAGAAHVDPKTLRDLLAQRRQPNLATVQAVCVALSLTLRDVVRFV